MKMINAFLASVLFTQHFIPSASFTNQLSSPYYNNEMHSQSLQKSPSVGIFQSIVDQRGENHHRTMKRFYASDPNLSSDATLASTTSTPSIVSSDISIDFSGVESVESLELGI